MTARATAGVAYAREKRMLLAWLALLAPLPLPFNQVLEWPALFAYALVLVYFLQRVERDLPTLLPNWALNVLGLVYLPLLYLDLRASFMRSRPVAALLHLVMFLILVKLYSMRREKDKWHLMIAAFFLFIGGMATSTHLTVAVFLVAFMVLGLLILARLAHLHVAAGLRRAGEGESPEVAAPRAPSPQPVPFRLPLAAGTALVLAVAIPTFAFMPRLREPFILGPAGRGDLIRTTGFSDSVDLSLTTAIRTNRDVALRLRYSGGAAPAGKTLRFKGASYDRYENRRWHRRLQHSTTLTPRLEGSRQVFTLAAGEAVGEVEVFRERLSSTSLLLPMETLALDVDLPALHLDLGGAAYLAAMPAGTLTYRARLAAGPRIRAQLARLDGGEVSPLTALDQSGVTDRMRELARQVMGEGPPEMSVEEQVDRLERHLMTQYDYTLDFLGREGETPLEDFLFVYRSGHCEYFASSMVLLLRAENVPARLVTGFLGAEHNPLEGYHIVRQENAHAWVEAYTPARGWRVYDPTPPEGRPSVPERGLLNFMSQIYDYLTYRWDRYVLTYGAEDQRTFFGDLRKRLAEAWRDLTGWALSGEKEPREFIPGVDAPDGVIREGDLWLSRVPLALAAVVFLAGILALLVWRRRRPLTGEAAYRALRRLLERAGLEITESLAPLELQELAVARYPGAAAPTRSLVTLYLRESFAEEPLAAAERAGLREHLQAIGETIGRPGPPASPGIG